MSDASDMTDLLPLILHLLESLFYRVNLFSNVLHISTNTLEIVLNATMGQSKTVLPQVVFNANYLQAPFELTDFVLESVHGL